MKRRLFAAVWVAGATVPLLMAVVLLAGCCALPFHHLVHKVMPLCAMAVDVMRGGDSADRDATPARETEPVKRIVTQLPSAIRLASASSAPRTLNPTPTTHYRSFITLGAIRCDRDVGLHLLVETFLL